MWNSGRSGLLSRRAKPPDADALMHIESVDHPAIGGRLYRESCGDALASDAYEVGHRLVDGLLGVPLGVRTGLAG
jgi:hypothetical protein